MKRVVVQKVKDLKAPVRRWLQSALGRPLRDREEVTVMISAGPEGGADDGTRSCYEAARRARLIGIVKDAPPDLSTNKKYFEGFGT